MKTTDLPRCKCGSLNWQNHGGTMGSGFAQWNYCCCTCGRPAAYTSERGGNLFWVGNDSKDMREWLAGPVDATLAERAAKIKDAEDERSARCRARVVAKVGFDPDHMTMDDSQYKQWQDAWDIEDRDDPFVMPAEFVDAPMLPGAPLGLHAFIRRGDAWLQIDPLASAALPVPPHPRRVRMMEVFSRVLTAVERAVKHPIEVEEVENQYSKDRHSPWYCFAVNGVSFTAGRRKNVYEVRCLDGGIEVAAKWEMFSKRDQVTFNDAPLVIHAWTVEKLEEYLIAAEVVR